MEIKNGYLPISDQVTVGEALDSFLLNPKWQYFVSTDNYQVVSDDDDNYPFDTESEFNKS